MLLTVFTPTYNRSTTLGRTYESLCRQKIKDFEWLIIDDGSTDSTESLISEFLQEADFSIRYVKKENGGKHTAYNMALALAKGQLFVTVDSDDWLCDDSLSVIAVFSEELLSTKRIAGLIALKEYPNGSIIGDKFPEDLHVSSLKQLEVTGYGGERTLIFRTDIARKYPFPVIRGENFMSESVVYDRIGLSYDFLISNNVLTTCEYQSDGLSSNPYGLMLRNPGGYMIYYAQRIDSAIFIWQRISYILRYHAFKVLAGKEKKQYKYNGNSPFLIEFFSPIGFIVAAYYKYKGLR